MNEYDYAFETAMLVFTSFLKIERLLNKTPEIENVTAIPASCCVQAPWLMQYRAGIYFPIHSNPIWAYEMALNHFLTVGLGKIHVSLPRNRKDLICSIVSGVTATNSFTRQTSKTRSREKFNLIWSCFATVSFMNNCHWLLNYL